MTSSACGVQKAGRVAVDRRVAFVTAGSAWFGVGSAYELVGHPAWAARYETRQAILVDAGDARTSP